MWNGSQKLLLKYGNVGVKMSQKQRYIIFAIFIVMAILATLWGCNDNFSSIKGTIVYATNSMIVTTSKDTPPANGQDYKYYMRQYIKKDDKWCEEQCFYVTEESFDRYLTSLIQHHNN